MAHCADKPLPNMYPNLQAKPLCYPPSPAPFTMGANQTCIEGELYGPLRRQPL